ncbi:hypothetical protein LIER_07965 [Lithospermum erythrorhizon]|uniref:Uncharacterized protein n=1 Tax=Lithospermum erythrorhizon TaxID=34254 RepID=A0AAV3PAV3_LITER
MLLSEKDAGKMLAIRLRKRNNLVFGESNYMWEHSIKDGIRLAIDYHEANKRGDGEERRLQRGDSMGGHERWTALVLGFVKLNCDEACYQIGGRMSRGAVIRGSGGNF